jgi:CubicO group peptidase (beta-lactamase class C family)
MSLGHLRLGAVLVTLGFLIACDDNPTASQSIEVTPTPDLEGFPAELDALRVQLKIPGMSAAIAENGQVVWATGFGRATVETGRAATSATPFHLASLTKPFAATILMQLVEEGLLELEDLVSDYGVSFVGSGNVRVRHLLTHTSEGIPGTSYRYNGNRFGYLDLVIQSASGRSFAELLVERILEPLGLHDTAPNPRKQADFALTGLNRDDFMTRMAAGYEVKGTQVIPKQHPDHFGTAAGLVASARDVASFSMAIDEGQFLSPETWSSVFTPATSNSGETLPYGLGWFIQEYQGADLQWHYGYWTTNSSLIVRAPEKGLTFIVLANTQTLSSPFGLGGDNNVMRSTVAQLFVNAFVLGDDPLPGGGRPGAPPRRVIPGRPPCHHLPPTGPRR